MKPKTKRPHVKKHISYLATNLELNKNFITKERINYCLEKGVWKRNTLEKRLRITTEEYCQGHIIESYGRSEEGYSGILLHLGLKEPTSNFSVAYLPFGLHSIQGKSEDAMFVKESTRIIEGNKVYRIEEDSFLFFENPGSYSIFVPMPTIITRFGEQEKIEGIESQKEYSLEEKTLTCQWALMGFQKNSIIRPHIHEHKDEFFYFMDPVDVNLGDENPRKTDYKKTDGFVEVPKGTIHSFRNNYGNTLFHSLNLPDVQDDSRRLEKWNY
mgnify:CR=1 FL=1